MPNFRRVGAEAEDRAAQFLLEQGYTIITRRFRGGQGEIDIVALDGSTLVFVEVKMRTKGEPPEAAVGWTKRQRFASAAQAYLDFSGLHETPCRYDLIAVDSREIRHIQNAFEP